MIEKLIAMELLLITERILYNNYNNYYTTSIIQNDILFFSPFFIVDCIAC